ncbi:MAG: XdhC family protein, partial [Bacteroidales bacterium]
VQEIAVGASVSKKSGSHLFLLDNKVADGEDALCGGEIDILVDSDLERNVPVFEQIKHSFESRTKGVLVTVVTAKDDERAEIKRYWVTNVGKSSLPLELINDAKSEIEAVLVSSKPDDFREMKITLAGDKTDSSIFLEPVIPPLRLIIAGAGHIGKALSKIRQMLDFEVTVIDDRIEFANADNLRSADHIITGDIGNAIAQLEKKDDTYIVIVTRGHKDDARALRACIASDAAYIGMIGSRNKVAMMQRDFIANGWTDQKEWSRIYAPIGLDIRSTTVEEIAVSIAAQLIQVKNIRKSLPA